MVVPAQLGTTNGELAKWRDPDRERLRAQLSAANDELAAVRLELTDLQLRLQAFASYHDRLLAPLYAELDDVEAEIAEVEAARSGSADDLADAAKAREKADKSAKAAERATADSESTNGSSAGNDEPKPQVQPSEQARQLFRSLIKLCHPDLAADDADRERRETFTRLVNEAYANSDTDRLEELSAQWQASNGGPGSANGNGSGDGGGVPEQAIAEWEASLGAARAQIDGVRDEINALTATSLGQLLRRDDPLAALRGVARFVKNEISRQREVLSELVGL